MGGSQQLQHLQALPHIVPVGNDVPHTAATAVKLIAAMTHRLWAFARYWCQGLDYRHCVLLQFARIFMARPRVHERHHLAMIYYMVAEANAANALVFRAIESNSGASVKVALSCSQVKRHIRHYLDHDVNVLFSSQIDQTPPPTRLLGFLDHDVMSESQ